MAEVSVYVERSALGPGFGRRALAEVLAAGLPRWPSIDGTRRLDGQWRDCVIVEKLIGGALD